MAAKAVSAAFAAERHSTRPGARRSTDIRIECSAEACLCCLFRGCRGLQLYTWRCTFMARVTSAENKRFVSHGFCHCARRSLHCSGTRGPDTTCVLVAKVSCPGTHPMPRSRPRQRWSQGELDECRKFPNAYTHGPGRIPPHRAIRAYHYSQISAKAVPAGPMTGPRSAFRANGSASSSGKTLSSVNIILSRRAFKSQRNPAQRKGQRTGFMCPAQKWPVPDTASRPSGTGEPLRVAARRSKGRPATESVPSAKVARTRPSAK